MEKTIKSIKGFDKNLSCRGFKFEAGKSYEVTGDIKACQNGFHACPTDEHPLSAFEYYSPATSVFHDVDQSGKTDKDGNKIASAKITINAEISLGDLTKRAVEWVFKRAKWSEGPVATGHNEGATASGDHGAATASGDHGTATASGYQGAATASGDQGAATASGYQGAATASGNQGTATASGYQGAATASGYQGTATASGNQGAATASGNQGAATASGNQGTATASGYQGAATASGNQGTATASGLGGKVKGTAGNAMFAVERDDNFNIVSVACGIAGKDGVPADAWLVCKDGKLTISE